MFQSPNIENNDRVFNQTTLPPFPLSSLTSTVSPSIVVSNSSHNLPLPGASTVVRRVCGAVVMTVDLAEVLCVP